MRSAPAEPANLLGTGALPAADEAWLCSMGAVWAWQGPDGVIEFSTRPLRLALTDMARDLLASAPVASQVATPVSMPVVGHSVSLK